MLAKWDAAVVSRIFPTCACLTADLGSTRDRMGGARRPRTRAAPGRPPYGPLRAARGAGYDGACPSRHTHASAARRRNSRFAWREEPRWSAARRAPSAEGAPHPQGAASGRMRLAASIPSPEGTRTEWIPAVVEGTPGAFLKNNTGARARPYQTQARSHARISRCLTIESGKGRAQSFGASPTLRPSSLSFGRRRTSRAISRQVRSWV